MSRLLNLNNMFDPTMVEHSNILSNALYDNSEKVLNMSQNDERILNLEIK